MADVFPVLRPDLRDADVERSVDRARRQGAMPDSVRCVLLGLVHWLWDVAGQAPDRPDADLSAA